MVRGKDGVKTKMVKHVLVLTLREAYSEFTKDNGDIELSLDTFSKQRPLNVLLRHCLPKNVCVCHYHANVNFLITALNKHDDDFPANHRELLRATTCSPDNEENESCQQGTCMDCRPLNTTTKMLEMLGTTEATARAWYVRYLRWENEEDGEGKQRLRKNEKYGSLLEII